MYIPYILNCINKPLFVCENILYKEIKAKMSYLVLSPPIYKQNYKRSINANDRENNVSYDRMTS